MFTYIISLATLIGINAILAVTLNFILGYAGIFSLAHAIFFGIGAYTAAVAAMNFGADFAVATPPAWCSAAYFARARAAGVARARRILRCRLARAADARRHGVLGVEVRHRRHRRADRHSAGAAVRLRCQRSGAVPRADARVPRRHSACHPRAGALQLWAQPEGDPRRRDRGLRARQERRAAEDARRRGVVVVRSRRGLAVSPSISASSMSRVSCSKSRCRSSRW